jgi:hypothetical protein
VDTQILFSVRPGHGSGVRSVETVAGFGYRLIRVERLGASEHLLLGVRVANKVANQHWRLVSRQILRILLLRAGPGVHATLFATLIRMIVATASMRELNVIDEERTD